MASVYRATDTRLHVERAIKILAPEMAMSSKIMDRFEREARVMAQLEHPNVVPVHDVGHDGDVVYLVMSLFHDGSLDDQLQDHGPLPIRDAVSATLGVVRALQAAHKQGVIHRDVKPQNVLIDPHGQPRLCDFGIAHVTSDRSLTQSGALLGTWAFMAPEQRAGQPIDERVDTYAVGAMLYMLVTNEVPNELHATDAHDGQFMDFPDALREVIIHATRFHPADRHQDMGELAADLENLLTVLPVTPPIRLGTTPKPVLRGTTNETLAGWAEEAPRQELPFADETGHDALPPEASKTNATLHPAAIEPPSQSDLPEPSATSRWVVRGVGVAAVGLLGIVVLAVGGGIAGVALWSNTTGQATSPPPTPQSASAQPEPTAPEPTAPEPSAPVVEDVDPQPVVEPQAEPRPQPVPRPEPVEQTPSPVPPAREPEPAPSEATVVTEPVPAPQPNHSILDAQPGYAVTITSIPWSTLTIDGAAKGTTLWTDELPSGAYTVRLQAAGHPDLVRVLTVADGPLAFCWDFSEQAVCAR